MSYLLLAYGIFNLTFQTFKILHKRQKYNVLIQKHNAELDGSSGAQKIDEKAVLHRLDREDLIPLLKLWIVIAFAQFYEYYFDPIFAWIPFYNLVKVVCVAVLVIPQTKLGVILYDRLIAEFLHEKVEPIVNYFWPVIITILLMISNRLQLNALEETKLKEYTMPELKNTDEITSRMIRQITREGYRRNKKESRESFKSILKDDLQIQAFLDDILNEYNGEDDADDGWTEIVLEKSEKEEGGTPRLRFMSDFEEEELTEFFDAGSEYTLMSE